MTLIKKLNAFAECVLLQNLYKLHSAFVHEYYNDNKRHKELTSKSNIPYRVVWIQSRRKIHTTKVYLKT